MYAEERHQAIAELERMVALNPMRESTWAALISSLAAAGRRAEALSAFARLRHTLRETLGVHPPQELLALHEQILRGESLRAAPAATAANQLGEVSKARAVGARSIRVAYMAEAVSRAAVGPALLARSRARRAGDR